MNGEEYVHVHGFYTLRAWYHYLLNGLGGLILQKKNLHDIFFNPFHSKIIKFNF